MTAFIYFACFTYGVENRNGNIFILCLAKVAECCLTDILIHRESQPR